MLALIGAARQSVGMESYIYADDEIGRKAAKAPVERARSGREKFVGRPSPFVDEIPGMGPG